LGSENQNLPGFVALCPGGYPDCGFRSWASDFLPGAYQGTFLNTQYSRPEQLVQYLRNDVLAPADQQNQLDLLQALNREHQARRLLERGVRFVQVWTGLGIPWDDHQDLDTHHRKLAFDCDQAIAGLLRDLKQRGLLEDTLVVWGGEFGRTPMAQMLGGKVNGRDHNHFGFSMWMAGGGVKGGIVHGATDEFGLKAVEKPVHVHDLHATILHLLGFDHEKLTYRHAGRDFRLTDVHGNVVREILA